MANTNKDEEEVKTSKTSQLSSAFQKFLDKQDSFASKTPEEQAKERQENANKVLGTVEETQAYREKWEDAAADAGVQKYVDIVAERNKTAQDTTSVQSDQTSSSTTSNKSVSDSGDSDVAKKYEKDVGSTKEDDDKAAGAKELKRENATFTPAWTKWGDTEGTTGSKRNELGEDGAYHWTGHQDENGNWVSGLAEWAADNQERINSEITSYKTNDGKTYLTEAEVQEHQQELANLYYDCGELEEYAKKVVDDFKVKYDQTYSSASDEEKKALDAELERLEYNQGVYKNWQDMAKDMYDGWSDRNEYFAAWDNLEDVEAYVNNPAAYEKFGGTVSELEKKLKTAQSVVDSIESRRNKYIGLSKDEKEALRTAKDTVAELNGVNGKPGLIQQAKDEEQKRRDEVEAKNRNTLYGREYAIKFDENGYVTSYSAEDWKNEEARLDTILQTISETDSSYAEIKNRRDYIREYHTDNYIKQDIRDKYVKATDEEINNAIIALESGTPTATQTATANIDAQIAKAEKEVKALELKALNSSEDADKYWAAKENLEALKEQKKAGVGTVKTTAPKERTYAEQLELDTLKEIQKERINAAVIKNYKEFQDQYGAEGALKWVDSTQAILSEQQKDLSEELAHWQEAEAALNEYYVLPKTSDFADIREELKKAGISYEDNPTGSSEYIHNKIQEISVQGNMAKSSLEYELAVAQVARDIDIPQATDYDATVKKAKDKYSVTDMRDAFNTIQSGMWDVNEGITDTTKAKGILAGIGIEGKEADDLIKMITTYGLNVAYLTPTTDEMDSESKNWMEKFTGKEINPDSEWALNDERGWFTDEQIDNWYYILEHDGAVEAAKYALNINNLLASEYRDLIKENRANVLAYDAENHTASFIGQALAYPIVTPFMEMTSPIDYIKLRDQVKRLGTDIVNPKPSVAEYGNMITELYTNQIGESAGRFAGFANFAYGVYGSTIQSAEVVATGGLLGKALGFTDALTIAGKGAQNLVAGMFTDLTFFSGAATKAYHDFRDKGIDPQRALTAATWAGIAEAAFEHISFEKLYHAKDVFDWTSWKDWAIETAVSAAIEGSEEVFTSMANFLSEAAILGKDGSYWESVEKYQELGLDRDTAMKKAMWDTVGSWAVDFAAGAASGGLSVGASSAFHYKGYTNEINESAKKLGERINDAKIDGDKTLAQKLGEYFGSYEYYKEDDSVRPDKQQQKEIDTLKQLSEKATKGEATPEELGQMIVLANRYDEKLLSDFVISNRKEFMAISPGLVIDAATKMLVSVFGEEEAQKLLTSFYEQPDAFVEDSFATGLRQTFGDKYTSDEIDNIEYLMGYILTGNNAFTEEELRSSIQNIIADEDLQNYVLKYFNDKISQYTQPKKRSLFSKETEQESQPWFVHTTTGNTLTGSFEDTLVNVWKGTSTASHYLTMQKQASEAVKNTVNSFNEAIKKTSSSVIAPYRDPSDFFIAKGPDGNRMVFTREFYIQQHKKGIDPLTGEKSPFQDLVDTDEKLNADFDRQLRATFLSGGAAVMARYNLKTGEEKSEEDIKNHKDVVRGGNSFDVNAQNLRNEIKDIDRQLQDLYSQEEMAKASNEPLPDQHQAAVKNLEERKAKAEADLKILQERAKVRENGRNQTRNSGTSGRNASTNEPRNAGGIPYRQVESNGQDSGRSAGQSGAGQSSSGSSAQSVQQQEVVLEDKNGPIATMKNGTVVYDSDDPKANKNKLTSSEKDVLELAKEAGVDRLIFVDADQLFCVGVPSSGYFCTVDGKKTIIINTNRDVANGYHETMHYCLSYYKEAEKRSLLDNFLTSIFGSEEEASAFVNKYNNEIHQKAYAPLYQKYQNGDKLPYLYALYEEMLCDLWKGLNRYNLKADQFSTLQQKAFAFVTEKQIVEHATEQAKKSKSEEKSEEKHVIPPANQNKEEKTETTEEPVAEEPQETTEEPAEEQPETPVEEQPTSTLDTTVGKNKLRDTREKIRGYSNEELESLMEEIADLLNQLPKNHPDRILLEPIANMFIHEYTNRLANGKIEAKKQKAVVSNHPAEDLPITKPADNAGSTKVDSDQLTATEEPTTSPTEESTGDPLKDELNAIQKEIDEIDATILDLKKDRDRMVKEAANKDERDIIKGQANNVIKILEGQKKDLEKRATKIRSQQLKANKKNKIDKMDSAREANEAKGSKKKPHHTAETHIDNRNTDSVGKTSINAFQYDNPEVKPFYKRAAEILMRDLMYLQTTKRNEYNKGTYFEADTDFLEAVRKNFKSITDAIAACDAVIHDKGGENYVGPKRIEIFLDQMLTNGYTPINLDSEAIEPSLEYINLKGSLEGGTPFNARERAIDNIRIAYLEDGLTDEELGKIVDENKARTGYYDPETRDGQTEGKTQEEFIAEVEKNYPELLAELEKNHAEIDELRNYPNGERYHKIGDKWIDGSTGQEVSEEVARAHYERIYALEKRNSEIVDMLPSPSDIIPIEPETTTTEQPVQTGRTVSEIDSEMDKVSAEIENLMGQIEDAPGNVSEDKYAELNERLREREAYYDTLQAEWKEANGRFSVDENYTPDIYGKFSIESVANGTGLETLYQIVGSNKLVTLEDWIADIQNQPREKGEKMPTRDSLQEEFSRKVKNGQARVYGVARRNADGTVTEMEIGGITSEDMKNSPLGFLVASAEEYGRISKEEASRQYDFLRDLTRLLYNYHDKGLIWEVVGSEMFAAIKSNSDPQYNRTIDFSTVCKKTQAVIDAVGMTMQLLDTGLSKDEIKLVYKLVGEAGESTPCPVCYVFSRWMGLGSVLDNIKRYQVLYGDTAKGGKERALALVKEVQIAAEAKMAERGDLTFGKAVNAAQKDVELRLKVAESAFNDYEKALKNPNAKKYKGRNITTDENGNPRSQDYWAEQISTLAKEYDKFDAYKWAVKTRLINADLLVKNSEAVAAKLVKLGVKGNTLNEILQNAVDSGNNDDDFVELRDELQSNLEDLEIVDEGRLKELRRKQELRKQQTSLKAAVTKEFNKDFTNSLKKLSNIEEALEKNPNSKALKDLYENRKEFDSIGDEYVFRKNYKDVPDDILFDLNKGEQFARYYPATWSYRTTRGSGLGKAIMPYSDARVGEIIQGMALSNVNNIQIGKDNNAFLNLFVPAKREEAKKILATARKKMAAQNLIGGMRFQSTSDFRYEYASDYLLAFFEMQAMGANVQLYTKVLEAVDFFANVGCDVNLSVMPRDKGIGELTEKPADWETNYDRYYAKKNNKYVKLKKGDTAPEFVPGKYHAILYSDVTGVNGGAARAYVQKYDNVQMIMVGISADHINACLDSDDITFVIPFHGSGNSTKDIQQLMQLLGETIDAKNITDFTSYQTDAEKEKISPARDLRKKIVSGGCLINGRITLTAEEVNILEDNQILKDLFRRFYLDATDRNGRVDRTESEKNRENIYILSTNEDGTTSVNRDSKIDFGKVNDKAFSRKYYLDGKNECYGNFLSGATAGQIFPYEYWDKSLKQSEAKGNGDAFQEYCKSLGLIPRFSGWAKGKYDGKLDFTKNDNYWKLLIDRKMYDNQGNYRAQRQIDLSNIDAFRYSDENYEGDRRVAITDLNPNYGQVNFGNDSEFANRVNPKVNGRKDNSVISKINDPRKTKAIATIATKIINEARDKSDSRAKRRLFADTEDIRQAIDAGDYITAARMLIDDPGTRFFEENGSLFVETDDGTMRIEKNGDLIPVENTAEQAEPFMDDYATDGRFSVEVTDPDELAWLNKLYEDRDVIFTYKSYLEYKDKDGVYLIAPMAGTQRDENNKKQLSHKLRPMHWEKSVGNPNSKNIRQTEKGVWQYHLEKNDDGSDVWAAFNPYQHSGDLAINDQFAIAYRRPNLVTYICAIPKSELTSGYHFGVTDPEAARREDGSIVVAKDPVGILDWKTGAFGTQLNNSKRHTYLSRWLMPIRPISDVEVARQYKEIIDREPPGLAVPFNVVPPNVRNILEDMGVPIDITGTGFGEVQYRNFLNEVNEQRIQEGKEPYPYSYVARTDAEKKAINKKREAEAKKMREERGEEWANYKVGDLNAPKNDNLFATKETKTGQYQIDFDSPETLTAKYSVDTQDIEAFNYWLNWETNSDGVVRPSEFENMFYSHPETDFFNKMIKVGWLGDSTKAVEKEFQQFVSSLDEFARKKLLDNFSGYIIGSNVPYYLVSNTSSKITVKIQNTLKNILDAEVNKKDFVSLTQEQIDEYRPDYIAAIQQMQDRDSKGKAISEKAWHDSHQALYDLFKKHPELDYMKRLAYARTGAEKNQIRAEFEKLLSGINDRDALWQLAAYSLYPSMGVYNGGERVIGDYDKLKSVKRIFSNTIEKRRDQILAEAGVSSNVKLKAREYTLQEIIDMFNQLNRDEQLNPLAEKVFGITGNLGLTIRGARGTAFRESTVGGHQLGSVVEYNINRFNDLGITDQDKAGILLHELIHSCTQYAIKCYEGAYQNLHITPEMMDAVRQIKSVYEAIKNDPSFINKNGQRLYGTLSTSEMLSELSNPESRQALEKKNLFQRIVDAIKKFFGIDTKNAFDAASVGLDYLLDNFNYDAYLRWAEYANKFIDRTPEVTQKAERAIETLKHPGEVQLWNGAWVNPKYAVETTPGTWTLKEGYRFNVFGELVRKDPATGEYVLVSEEDNDTNDFMSGAIDINDNYTIDGFFNSEGDRVTVGKFSAEDGILSVTYFAGAGTLDYALRDRLFHLYAVEYDPEIRDMFIKNNGNSIMVMDADVNEVVPGAVIAGHVPYFHASPVCTNFSIANNKHGETERDRQFARAISYAIREWKIDVFTLENVKGYLGSDSLKIVTDTLDDIGYKWDVDVYRASDYGAATIRDRLFVRAVRNGELPPKPTKIGSTSWWDAVKDIVDTLPVMDDSGLTASRRSRLDKMGIDINNLKQPILLLSGTKGKGIQYAYADQPSPTLMTDGSEARIILTDGTILKVTPRVFARIQGLDDNFQFPTQKRNPEKIHQSNAFKIVGNGIPTQLTQAIVNPLLDTIDRNKGKFSTDEERMVTSTAQMYEDLIDPSEWKASEHQNMNERMYNRISDGISLWDKVVSFYDTVDKDSYDWLSYDDITQAMQINPYNGNNDGEDMPLAAEVMWSLLHLARNQEGSNRERIYSLMGEIAPHLTRMEQDKWIRPVDSRFPPVDYDFSNWYNEKNPSATTEYTASKTLDQLGQEAMDAQREADMYRKAYNRNLISRDEYIRYADKADHAWQIYNWRSNAEGKFSADTDPVLGLNFRDPSGELLEKVFDKTKIYETRAYTEKRGHGKIPGAYLNKPMGIVQTGAGQAMYVGRWELGDGEPKDYGWLKDHAAELGNDGTDFEAHPGDVKWVYPIKWAKRTEPMGVSSRGIRARSIAPENLFSLNIEQDSAFDAFGDEISIDNYNPEVMSSALSENLYYSDDGNTAYYQTPTGETVVLQNIGEDSPEVRYINNLEAMSNGNSTDTTATKPYIIPPKNRDANIGYSLGEQDAGLRRGTEEVPAQNQKGTLRPAGSYGELYAKGGSQSEETQGVGRFSAEEESPGAKYSTFYDADNDTFVNENGEVIATDDMYPIGSFTREIFKAMKSGDQSLKNVEDLINKLFDKRYNVYEEDINTVRQMIQINDAYTPEQREAMLKAMDELVKRHGKMRSAEEDLKKDLHFAVQRDQGDTIDDPNKPGKKITRKEFVKRATEGKDPFTGEDSDKTMTEKEANKLFDKQGTVIMKYTQTVARNAEQEWLTDEAVRMALTDESMSYTPVSNEKSIEEANRMFDKAGTYEKALANWDGFVNSGAFPRAADVAFGELLLKSAAEQGRITDAIKLVSDLTIMAHYTGQSLQAFRILKKMTPRGQLYYLQSVVDDLNKKYKNRIDNPNNKQQKIVLKQELVEKLLSSSTREELDTAIEEIKKDLGEQIPATWVDQWNAWRYLAMLGNPRTHIRNMVGNGAFAPAVFFKDMIARRLENKFVDPALRMRISGADLSKNSAYRQRAEQDFEVMSKIIAGEAGGNKYSDIQDILGTRQIFKWGLLDKIEKYNGKKLGDEDMFFMHIYYTRAFAEALQARGIKEEDVQTFDRTPEGRKTLNEIRNWAMIEAQRNTYHDANVLATTLNQLKRKSPVAYVLLEGLVPFTKTPANILKRGIEYSPIGLISSSINLARDLRSGQYTTSQCIDRFAAGWTGTAFMALGYLLAKGLLGLKLRGAGPEDDKEAEFEKLQGHQNWSLEVGGKYSYTIDWMAPIALPLFVGQTLYAMLHGDHPDLTDTDNWLILLKLADPMLSLSMLDGIENAFSTLSNTTDTSKLGAFALSMGTSYLSQGMPTLLGQVARSIDPDRRSTYIQKGAKGSTLQKFVQSSIQSKVPLWESKKMAYVDEWGRKDSSDTVGEAVWKIIENFVSPGYGNVIEQTPVDAELQRLYESTGNKELLPNKGSKYWNYGEGENKVEKDLTGKEYEEFSMTRGQTRHEMLAQLFNSEMYQDATDKEKEKMVENVYSYSDKYAKTTITPEYEMDHWMDVAQKIGPVDYILLKQEYEDNKSNEKIFTWLANNPNLNEDQVATLIADKFNPPDNVSSVSSDGFLYDLKGSDEDIIKEVNEQIIRNGLKELYSSEEYRNAPDKDVMLKQFYEDARTETLKVYGEMLDQTDRVKYVGKAASIGAESFGMVLNLTKDDVKGNFNSDIEAQSYWLGQKYKADASINNPLHEGYSIELDKTQKSRLESRFRDRWNEAYDELLHSEKFQNAPSKEYQDDMIARRFNQVATEVENEFASELYQAGGYTETFGKPGSFAWAKAYEIADRELSTPQERAEWLAGKYSPGSSIADPDQAAYEIPLTAEDKNQLKKEFKSAYTARYVKMVTDPAFKALDPTTQEYKKEELRKDVASAVETAYARRLKADGYASVVYDDSANLANKYEYLASNDLSDDEKIQIIKDSYVGGTIANAEARGYRKKMFDEWMDNPANTKSYLEMNTADGYEKMRKAADKYAGNLTKQKYGNVKNYGDIENLDLYDVYYTTNTPIDSTPPVKINEKATTKTDSGALIKQGNIDLNARPVVRNSDGSYSTVDTVTWEVDGEFVNIPTVIYVEDQEINGEYVSEGWVHVDADQALEHYYETGEHLGIYKDKDSAVKAAEKLHKDQAKQYNAKASQQNFWSNLIRR